MLYLEVLLHIQDLLDSLGTICLNDTIKQIDIFFIVEAIRSVYPTEISAVFEKKS